MSNLDPEELDVLGAFEKGKFKSVARATAIKDKRVNIRLSSGDLSDLQVRA